MLIFTIFLCICKRKVKKKKEKFVLTDPESQHLQPSATGNHSRLLGYEAFLKRVASRQQRAYSSSPFRDAQHSLCQQHFYYLRLPRRISGFGSPCLSYSREVSLTLERALFWLKLRLDFITLLCFSSLVKHFSIVINLHKAWLNFITSVKLDF